MHLERRAIGCARVRGRILGGCGGRIDQLTQVIVGYPGVALGVIVPNDLTWDRSGGWMFTCAPKIENDCSITVWCPSIVKVA